MKKYNFTQFKTEINDPTVEVKAMVYIDVTLSTPNGSKFGLETEQVELTQEQMDALGIAQMVDSKLQESEIKE